MGEKCPRPISISVTAPQPVVISVLKRFRTGIETILADTLPNGNVEYTIHYRVHRYVKEILNKIYYLQKLGDIST